MLASAYFTIGFRMSSQEQNMHGTPLVTVDPQLQQEILGLKIPGVSFVGVEPGTPGQLFFSLRSMFVKAMLMLFVMVFCLSTLWASLVWSSKGVLVLSYVFLKYNLVFMTALVPAFFTFWALTIRILYVFWRVTPDGVFSVGSRTNMWFVKPLLDVHIMDDGRADIVASDWLFYFNWSLRWPVVLALKLTSLIRRFYVSRGWVLRDASVPVLRGLATIPKEVVDKVANGTLDLESASVELATSDAIQIWGDGVADVEPLFALPILVGRLFMLMEVSTWTVFTFFPYFVGMLALTTFLWAVKFGVKALLALVEWLLICVAALFFIWITPAWVSEAMFLFLWVNVVRPLYTLVSVVAFNPSQWYAGYRLAKDFVLVLIPIWVLNCIQWGNRVFTRRKSRRNPFAVRTRLAQRFNHTWVAVQQVVADMALPDFIRTSHERFSIDALSTTFDKLQQLGWPVNVAVSAYADDQMDEAFPGWRVGSIDFRQGIRRIQVYIDEELEDFEKTNIEVYKRTDTYATYANELFSTSRYFKDVDYKFSDLQADEVWSLISEIFAGSKLTPFSTVIRKWNKKYGLGAFAKKLGRWGDRKMSRRELIKTLGPSAFKKLWAETFKWAPSLTPLAPVSVKNEAIPPRKWMADKVRTVIGAPLTHYISSTVFNYAANHNFKPYSTPIKIGMPLTGLGMEDIWVKHSLKDIHYAGDCSDFDSTLSGRILEIIKNVRKRGFSHHKDYKRICDLIDLEYENISHQLLALTSHGGVYRKGTGLSTGHSSTSMDNSIGMVCLYMMAWKSLTGLGASHFRHYNELSVFGDDHLLSWSRDAPPAWTFANIQKEMATWGVTNNLEGEGELSSLEFLSKRGRKPTADDISELTAAGVPVPEWVIYHNPSKLIGKVKANVDRKDLKYQATRIKSYLYLCAHHRGLFDQLVAALVVKVGKIQKYEPTFKISIPTYSDVLQEWYTAGSSSKGFQSSLVREFVVDDDEELGSLILTYGEVTLIDSLFNMAGRVVDIVNPDVFNSGITSFLQRPLLPFLRWPIQLIREANWAHTDRHTAQLLARSPYDWITNDVEMPVARNPKTATSRLIKHWVYCLLCSPGGGWSFSPKLVWLDKKLADIKCLLFGYLDLTVRRVDMPFWNCILVAALGAVPDVELPDYRQLPFLMHFLGFSFGGVIDTVFNSIVTSVFSKAPPNFTSVKALIQSLVGFQPVVVSAPTGSGKTTTMAALLKGYLPVVDRVVVVVPRSAIVVGVVPYMKKKYGGSISGYTTGMAGEDTELIYCTSMEVLLHPMWINQHTLFLFDECHVDEPLHNFCLHVLEKRAPYLVMASATPTPAQLGKYRSATLRVANVWHIEELNFRRLMGVEPIFDNAFALAVGANTYREHFMAYQSMVHSFVRNASPDNRTLIFVCTRAEQESMAHSLQGRGSVCMIYSGHTEVDPKAQIIITTSVSDVGVTIEDVNHVISMDALLEIRSDPHTGKTVPVYSSAGPALLKQRRGRTGRTCDGKFILYDFCRLPERVPCSLYENVVGAISSGLSLGDVIDYAPDWVMELSESQNLQIQELKDTWESVKLLRLGYGSLLGQSAPLPNMPSTAELRIPSLAEDIVVTSEPLDNGLAPYTFVDDVMTSTGWTWQSEVGWALSAVLSNAARGFYFNESHRQSLVFKADDPPKSFEQGVIKNALYPLQDEINEDISGSLREAIETAERNISVMSSRLQDAKEDLRAAISRSNVIWHNPGVNRMSGYTYAFNRARVVADFKADMLENDPDVVEGYEALLASGLPEDENGFTLEDYHLVLKTNFQSYLEENDLMSIVDISITPLELAG